MKFTFTLFFLTLVIFSKAQSAEKVLCKNGGKIYDALTEEGHFECKESLFEGLACFTGNPKTIVRFINEGGFNWDEEWLSNAVVKANGTICYVFEDGPNDLKTPACISRCKN